MKKTMTPGEATDTVKPVLNQKPGSKNLQVTKDSALVKGKLGKALLSLEDQTIIENKDKIIGYLDDIECYLRGEKNFFLVQLIGYDPRSGLFSIELKKHKDGKISHDGEDLHTAVQSLTSVHTQIKNIGRLKELSKYHFCTNTEEIKAILSLVEAVEIYPKDERIGVIENTIAKIQRMTGVDKPEEVVRILYT